MKNFFITGTDTGVGKTITAAALTLALQGCYWKPIQSGIEDEASDQSTVKDLTSLSESHFFPSAYNLQASLSPDQAAKLENIQIHIDNLQLPLSERNVIVEGAGGIYVPLNSQQSNLDLMQKLQLPIIVVCRGTLGTINHSLLTIKMLQHVGLRIHGLVFCGALHAANQKAIEEWTQVPTLFTIPFFEELTSAVFKNWVSHNQEKITEYFI